MWPFRKKPTAKAPTMSKVDLSVKDAKPKDANAWPPEDLIGYYDIQQDVEGFTIRYRAQINDNWVQLGYNYHRYVQYADTYGQDREWVRTDYWPTLQAARASVVRHNATKIEERRKAEHAKNFPKKIESLGPKHD